MIGQQTRAHVSIKCHQTDDTSKRVQTFSHRAPGFVP